MSSHGDGSSGAAEWQEELAAAIHSPAATAFAACSTALTLLLSGCHAVSHLRRFSQPQLQRYVVRIIFMAPIYSGCSYVTLQSGALWLNAVRDVYEAWVIHCFLALLFEYLGGEAAIVNHLKEGPEPRLITTSWFWGTCCIDPLWPSKITFLKFCKGGTLQFALLKPILAAMQLLMQWSNIYAGVSSCALRPCCNN